MDEFIGLTISLHRAETLIECLNGKEQFRTEIGHIQKKNLMRCCLRGKFSCEKTEPYQHSRWTQNLS